MFVEYTLKFLFFVVNLHKLNLEKKIFKRNLYVKVDFTFINLNKKKFKFINRDTEILKRYKPKRK